MRRFSREDYINAVRDLVDAIVSEYEGFVEAIYAGGSYARGDFTPECSDIDIYVVLKEGDKVRLGGKA